MVGFTSKQIERAKLARKLYNNVGLPTVKNSKDMVSTNMILHCPISVADIWNAEKIYGPLMEIINGNSTKSNPRPVIKDDIHIPSDIYKNNSKI